MVNNVSDWVIAIIMLIIWIAFAALLAFLQGGLVGVVLGVMAGYLIASQVVQRLPGFWKR